MKKSERTYRMYLEDILTSMDRILEYVEGFSISDFRNDYKTVDAVIRNFMIIGEATRNIPAEIKARYSDVPWDEMYLLRNKVSHEYFGIDYEIIWDIVSNYIPENRVQIEKVLSEEF
jgi:uncharacterized protein with HEPN domain